MSDEADNNHLTFNIKSSSDAKYVVTVPETMTVLELKEKLSTTEYADVPAERQRLIYSGRVLKDPDVLSVYKIKDGNTVHMVKGAASNARQNPANSSSSATVPGAGQPPSGVPTNLATGTGNDPMAQLTGARYAGFAQLPGADMFGADGGMGPPPNPEDMLTMLENPMFASQMNEAMNNPEVIRMMQNNPMIRDNPMMRNMLENPEMRRMLMDPALIRQSMRMQGMFGGGGARGGNTGSMPAPGVTDTTPQGSTGTTGSTPAPSGTINTQNPLASMLGGGGAGSGGNPFASLFGAPPPAVGSTGTDVSRSVGSSQGQQANPFAQLLGGGGAGGAGGMPNFSPEMMQQMMSMFGGGGGGGGAAGGANPFGMGGFGGQQSAAAPADTRPPEEIYSEQLRQLNEMGFYEFDRNVRALRMAGGNVQGAIELLFSGNL